MNKYEIKEPIWMTKSIGIASHRLKTDLFVDILYRDKDGQRVYPNTYIIRKDAVNKYPFKILKGHKIYEIPISDLEVFEVFR